MSDLVLIANAKDNSITVHTLDGASLTPLATTVLAGSCSTFAVDEASDLVYAGIKAPDADSAPAIVTLRLDRTSGVLSEIGRRDVPGPLVSLELTRGGTLLLGASYHAGLGHVWPVGDGLVGEPTAEVRHANLHCVQANAAGDRAYFVSLGDTLIAQFELDAEGHLTPLAEPTVAETEGCGPRHLILDEARSNAYLITEYSGEIIRHDLDADGALHVAESVSIVDPQAGLQHSRFGAEPLEEGLIWGADLQLARDGRFIIGSERNASTLATVALDADGRLGEVVALRGTQTQPRGFRVTPDTSQVIAVGERATQAALYGVEDSGKLTDEALSDTGRGANWVRIVQDAR